MNSPLRTAIPREIFDYQQAMSALEGYSTPRGHLAALMRKKAIIRVKGRDWYDFRLVRRPSSRTSPFPPGTVAATK